MLIELKLICDRLPDAGGAYLDLFTRIDTGPQAGQFRAQRRGELFMPPTGQQFGTLFEQGVHAGQVPVGVVWREFAAVFAHRRKCTGAGWASTVAFALLYL